MVKVFEAILIIMERGYRDWEGENDYHDWNRVTREILHHNVIR